MPTLYIMRHAEAGAHASDRLRPLTANGQQQAEKLGRLLAARGAIDLCLVSSAARTVQTFEAIQNSMPSLQARIEDHLYNASEHVLLDAVRTFGGDASSVMVIAHNPGVGGLASRLSSSPFPPAFPPAGLAVFDCPAEPWASLQDYSCQLKDFIAPGALRDYPRPAP